MTAPTTYTVERTAPTVYLDARGQAVQGYIVFVKLDAYDESHEVRVPSLSTNIVKKAVDDLVQNRDAIANLGKSNKSG